MRVLQKGGWRQLHCHPAVRLLTEFTVLLQGNAAPLLLEIISGADEISGLEMFALIAGVVPLGEQLGGESMISSLDANASADAPVMASSGIQMI